MRAHLLVLVTGGLLCGAPLVGCATGKAEVPDGVKRFTGNDEGCHSGGFGAGSAVQLANKTVAGATKGVVTNVAQGVSSFDDIGSNVAYAPIGIVAGVFTGIVEGIGAVPADVDCHYTTSVFGYPWTRDDRTGVTDAQVPEHRAPRWNGGAYWPGGPR